MITESGPAVFDPIQEKQIKKLFKNTPKVISGDIHDAQVYQSGNTEWHFIGCPVHLNFGDTNHPCYTIYDTESEAQESILLPPEKSPRKILKNLKSREEVLEFLKSGNLANFYRISGKTTEYQKKRIQKKFLAEFV